jgi:hypothetical protein
MAEKLRTYQQANGGAAAYSFQLPEAHWQFLGENWAGTDRVGYKPTDRTPVQINDRIAAWGQPAPSVFTSGAGHRAFEGGPAPGNVALLQGAGGAFRCAWDTIGDQMWHVAGSTGSDDIKQGLMKYRASTDEFLHWTAGGEYTGVTLTVTSVASANQIDVSGAPERAAGFYDQFGLEFPAIPITDPNTRATFTKRVVSYTPLGGTSGRFVLENQPGDTTVRPSSFVGDTCKFRDSPAALYPWRGSAHNFGTSAWDSQRRRLYKMMRLPSQGPTFWPCWIDVEREQEYGTRAEWIAGRNSWFGGDVGAGWDFFSLWPQCVFIPDLGDEGSLIILSNQSQWVRWDCAVGRSGTGNPWSEYSLSFNIKNTPKSGNAATSLPSAITSRGNSMVYHNGFVYVASMNGAVNGDPATDAELQWEFWRFSIPADGSEPSYVTNLAKCPVGMDLSGYGWPGTHTELCVLNGKIYAFHTDLWGTDGEREYTGGVYCYDINANTWSMCHDSWTQKLIALGRVNATTGSSPHNFTVTEIPRLGVFLMVQQIDDFASAAWLFAPPL